MGEEGDESDEGTDAASDDTGQPPGDNNCETRPEGGADEAEHGNEQDGGGTTNDEEFSGLGGLVDVGGAGGSLTIEGEGTIKM